MTGIGKCATRDVSLIGEHPTRGVAQGTVLGPLVFLALINSALQDKSFHFTAYPVRVRVCDK